MAKLFPEKVHLDGTSRLQKSRNNNQIFKVLPSKNKHIGSSIVELLLATTLALTAASVSAQMISRLYTSGMNSRAAANSAVEVAINNDLAWFRRYAVRWRRDPDPSVLSYVVPPGCGETTPPATTMANAFLSYANTSTTYSPSTDTNTVPNSTISLPNSTSGYILTRVIQSDDNVSGALIITYTLTVPSTTTPIFVRSSSLYLPAAGWCP
jgi:hypothetical protein